MVRPSPSPPYCRVAETPPCSKISKIRGKIVGLMPIPLSTISMIRLGGPPFGQVFPPLRDRDRDGAAGGSELDRILEQVPQDLLQSDRVGIDEGRLGGDLRHQTEAGIGNLIPADRQHLFDKFVCVGGFALEMKFVEADP